MKINLQTSYVLCTENNKDQRCMSYMKGWSLIIMSFLLWKKTDWNSNNGWFTYARIQDMLDNSLFLVWSIDVKFVIRDKEKGIAFH